MVCASIKPKIYRQFLLEITKTFNIQHFDTQNTNKHVQNEKIENHESNRRMDPISFFI